jgi:hypothetical protein
MDASKVKKEASKKQLAKEGRFREHRIFPVKVIMHLHRTAGSSQDER